MKKIFKNKTILITGGTGSFGKAMISYLLKNVNNFKAESLQGLEDSDPWLNKKFADVV